VKAALALARTFLGSVACVVLAAVAALADPFSVLRYHSHQQDVISCPANFECDIELESGERINNGYNAWTHDWDPHVGYTGDRNATPHLVLKPYQANLRTNIILTTTRRTYYFLVSSTNDSVPRYYRFEYDVPRQLTLRHQPKPRPRPEPTPVQDADLYRVCIDYAYSYLIDTNPGNDHAHRATASTQTFPAEFIPQVACTDGRHTFVQFPFSRETSADLPLHLAVTPEGDTIANATYVFQRARYVIDGVYPDMVLEMGSQSSPIRLRILHSRHFSQRRHHHDTLPTPIIPPLPGSLVIRQ
jgi:type IV secretion system protein TrbG